MCRRTVRITASRAGRVALAIGLTAVLAHRVRAADEIEKIQAEAGRQWYDKYCTPCHGPAGAPGTAVYPDTRKPVDLRNYVQRNGGKFPAARWIAVVATDNPALVHTDVWHRIHDSQKGGSISSDAAAKAVVASIASYVRLIQK
jgi:mono/diheme cytochrome c family protein